MAANSAEAKESKGVDPQAEVEVCRDPDAIEAPPEMHIEVSPRRQRRPAADIPARPPRHPGRPPDAVGRPHPSAARVQLPAAIVKRRPAPGVVRLPKPPGVRVNPMAAIAVGPPSARDHDRPRLPAPAESFEGYPGPVGRKIDRKSTR